MNKVTDELKILDLQTNKQIAKVVLNGYNIDSDGGLGQRGMMRSFTITSGDLWDQWSLQQILNLRDEAGREAQIRIAALPVEQDSYGLIEFL